MSLDKGKRGEVTKAFFAGLVVCIGFLAFIVTCTVGLALLIHYMSPLLFFMTLVTALSIAISAGFAIAVYRGEV